MQLCGLAAFRLSQLRLMGTFRFRFINPRRACAARVTVVVLCVCMCMCVCMYVCMCVCTLIPAASHIGITKERYQRILRNTGIVLNLPIFLKMLRSKVMA